MTKRSAFTLAEVLITLGIIGVVAAMTIPTLMSNTGKQEFKTGFKKMISVMNQAVTMNYALDSSDLADVVGTSATADINIYGILNNRMNVARIETGAIAEMGTVGEGNSGLANNYSFFFNDGMMISFPKTAATCTKAAPCKALVDVNGTKKPNQLTSCTQTSGICNENSLEVRDQFPVLMFGQQVVPNGTAAKETLFK